MSREFDLDAFVLAAALLLLVVTLAIATVPALEVLVPSPLRGFGEVFGASIVSWMIAVALALAALVGLGFLKGRHRAASDSENAQEDGEGPGSGDAAGRDAADAGSPGPQEIVGGTLTEEYLQRRDELRSRRGSPEFGPTEGLRNAAIAEQLARGHDAETAHERLRSGAWTDDPVAAAFLGDETAGTLSFRRRLYAVIYPHRAFERRFERTLAELEAAAERTSGIGGSVSGYGGSADDAESQRDRSAVESDRGGADQRAAGGT